MSPYLSVPKSRTRRRISIAGEYETGTLLQPDAGAGAAPAKGAWPANPAGMVELEPERSRHLRVIGRGDVVRRDPPAGEEAPVVDGRAVDRHLRATGELDLGDPLAGALGRLRERLGARDPGAKGAGRTRERRAVDVEGVVGRAVDPGPGAGGEAVPAGAGIRGRLGQEAVAGRLRPLAKELAEGGECALAGPALDEILPEPVADEEEGGFAGGASPPVTAASPGGRLPGWSGDRGRRKAGDECRGGEEGGKPKLTRPHGQSLRCQPATRRDVRRSDWAAPV